MSDVLCGDCGWVYDKDSTNSVGRCEACQKAIDDGIGIGKPPRAFKAPEGWLKGDPVRVDKRIRHNVVHLEVTRDTATCPPRKELAVGVYCIYFRYWEEFSRWMKWWFE